MLKQPQRVDSPHSHAVSCDVLKREEREKRDSLYSSKLPLPVAFTTHPLLYVLGLYVAGGGRDHCVSFLILAAAVASVPPRGLRKGRSACREAGS